MENLSRIISSDPALVSRVLRVANSSLYGMATKVDSLQRALSVLGIDMLKNIALSFVISRNLKGFQENGFDFDQFWKRSVTAGVAAEVLSDMIDVRGGDIFVTALLQDIGIVIMYLCNGSDYIRVLDEKRTGDDSIEIVEQTIFGFDHQELGAEILKEWGLPKAIHGPIGCHHKTSDIPTAFQSTSNILRISDRLSSIYHGSHSNEKIQEVKAVLLARHGIENDRVDLLVDTVAEKSIEILSFFDLDPGNMKPFSQLLQEANAELGKLNFSYEQLVLELKQSKAETEKLARELRSSNQKLRELASKDSLTNLYNHRAFQELTDVELRKTIRHHHSISLIMFDLDHFKAVNDKYGHLAGDAVLRAVSSKIAGLVRYTDVLGRYGGDEFILVLPETDLKGAVVLAERIRNYVEKMEISVNGSTLRVTLSMGIATCSPGTANCRKETLIDAADKALYQAKTTGRNKISATSIAAQGILSKSR